MKKIAIIRALDLRISQAEYAAHFRKLESFFISNENKEIYVFLEKKKVSHISLKLNPLYLFDPVKLFLGKVSHQSWLTFERKNLKNTLKPIDYYQIQEPFFMYSGQIAEIARKFNKPLIMAPFMCFNHPSSYLFPYSLSVRKSIGQADLYIMRTERVNNYLSRFNIPDRKKVLIHHGVNLKRFYPPVMRDNAKIKILFVGALNGSKGLDNILDILPRLVKATKKKIELIICGSGNLEERVRNMVKILPINYMGQVSNLALPDIYRQSDIFCGPSRDVYLFGIKMWEEQFGFVFAEAMASGLPIVANNCGTLKEVVGGNNYLNKQGDKQALFDSLLGLIEDEKARREIGIKNRQKAERYFDMEKQIAREEEEINRRFG